MATVIDTLIYQFGFKTDTRGLRHAESRVDRFSRRVNTAVAGVARGFGVASTAALGIGAAAFFTGSKAEREFLKLQTQLGLTKEQIAAVRPEIEALSRETGRPLAELAEAYFSLRSAGLDAAAAQDTLRASAYSANAQLGSTRDIAHIAGGAINAYGADVISGSRATDILIGTVKEGNLEARNLIRPFGQLLQVAPLLGVELESLGAIIAGATRNSVPANEVITQLRQVLFGLLRPTVVAKNKMEDLGISAEGLQRRVREDGLIATLQWLRREVGEDTETFTRLFESQEAVGLILDITGGKADDYTTILNNLRSATGATDEAQRAWAETALSEAETATNEAKLALDSLYNRTIVPLLKTFGRLPEPIQRVAVLFGVLSGASLLLGGPLGLISTAFGVIKAPLLLVTALFGLLSLKFIVVGALIAALVIGIKWLVDNWDLVVEKVREVWKEHGGLVIVIGNVLGVLGLLIARQLVLGSGMGFVIGRVLGLGRGFGGLITSSIRLGGRFGILGLRLAGIGWAAATTGARGFHGALGSILGRARELLPKLATLGGRVASFGGSALTRAGGVVAGAARAAAPVLGGATRLAGPAALVAGGLAAAGGITYGIVTGKESDAPRTSRNLLQRYGLDALDGYARGGLVPGARGRARLAMVHGGEMVLPPDIADFLGGIVRGPPPPPAMAMAGSRSITVNVGDINVEVQAAPGQNTDELGDRVARAVERKVKQVLQDEFESLAAAFDSDVRV